MGQTHPDAGRRTHGPIGAPGSRARARTQAGQRIERSEVLFLGLRVVMMTTPSGQQEHYVLDSTLVPFWLATMDARPSCSSSSARWAGSTW